MHTQCPHCHTHFQVSAAQLKAANGEVRCGKCLNTFSALNHLSEKSPRTDPVGMGTTNLAHDQQANNDIFSFDEDDAEFAELAREFGHLPMELGSPPSDDTPFDTIHTASTDEGMDEIIDEILEEALAETTDASGISSEPNDMPLGNTDEIIVIEAEDLEASGFDIPPANTTSDTKHSAATDIPANNAGIVNVPSIILDDLRSEKAARLRPSGISWAMGSLFLMLILLLQAVYFERDNLARDPQYRPWLERLCRLTGCTLAQLHDIRQIDIIGRDVRTHPHARKALIASTTLINKASFAQPYPLLTLSFSNITGSLLAQRRFTPREYLHHSIDITAGMPPNLPIQVELELVDPGKAAINYEFRAESNPRAITPAS